MGLHNMSIITYWEGPKPLLIRVLHQLMELHCSFNSGDKKITPFHCITKDEFLANKSGAYSDYFSNLSEAAQADIARVEHIYENGGIWLDSDTLVMTQLQALIDLLTSKNGFFVTSLGKRGTKLCNGVFGSRGQTKLLEEWQDMIDCYITRKEQPAHGDFGFRCLGRLIAHQKEYFDDYIIFDGQKTMFPVAWFESEKIFLKGSSNPSPKIEREFQPLIILVNKVYSNYNQLPDKPGEGCTLDYYIQQSLMNSINPDKAENKSRHNSDVYNEYDKKRLHWMARNIFDFN